MKPRQARHRGLTALKRGSALLLLLTLTFGLSGRAAAESPELRRLQAGLDLFPSVLAADIDIREKTSAEGVLNIAVIYENNPQQAEDAAARLRQVARVKNIPLRVLIINPVLLEATPPPVAGIFISEPRLRHLGRVVAYGKANAAITFSPFQGDISAGVASSIQVTANILPQVNTNTLRVSGLRLKPFFLRIASHY
ncbi:MAG: hypothetical protein ABFR97_04470 [Thermodesulfobacteriota bacterium]